MSLRRLRASVALGLLVASACATQTNDGPSGTDLPEGDAGDTSSGGAEGGAVSGVGGALGGASHSEAGKGGTAVGVSGGAGANALGGAGAATGGSAGMIGIAGAGKGGGSGNGAGGTLGTAGAGKGGSSGGGMGGTLGTAGAGKGGSSGGGAAGSPSAGAGGSGTTCNTPSTLSLDSIRDAEINAQAPTANVAYVAEAHIVRNGTAGSHRAVFWFDFGAVPAGKALKTAKLQLTVANNPGLSKTLAVHRISQGSNRAWLETEVTWQAWKAGSNWTTAGGDFVAQASDTQAIADATAAGTVLSFNVLADAQSFYGAPSTNYGWLLKDTLDATNNSGEQVYIATRENTTNAPPKLVLTYCP